MKLKFADYMFMSKLEQFPQSSSHPACMRKCAFRSIRCARAQLSEVVPQKAFIIQTCGDVCVLMQRTAMVSFAASSVTGTLHSGKQLGSKGL